MTDEILDTFKRIECKEIERSRDFYYYNAVFLVILCSVLSGIIVWCYFYGQLHFTSSKISSYDWINESSILTYSDKVVIREQNITLVRYHNSGSMRPMLDGATNGLVRIVNNESDIHLGDIISFKVSPHKYCFNKTYCINATLVVHRVIRIGYDKKGIYFITKGDNNWDSDGKVRYNQIESILVGVIF